MKVLLVDDHEPLRKEIRKLLESDREIQVVGEAATGKESVRLAAALLPDVVVMDVLLPDISGIEATRRITMQDSHVRVVALSNHRQAEFAQAMLKAGGVGYVLKERAFEELIPAIRAILSGKKYMGEHLR